MLKQIWKGHLSFLRLVMSLAVMALVVIGLVTIYATSPGDAKKQLVWIALSMVGFVVINLVHYRMLGRAAYGIFILSLVLLSLVLVGKKLGLTSVVPSIRGASRWINVIPGSGSVRIQPSEIAKIAYILALAWYLRHRSSYRNLTGLIGPFALTMLPMVLILLEPDLGTVLLFLPILFGMLFAAGARIKHLLAIIMIAVLCSPALYLLMKDYQRERVQVLLKQNSEDPYWLRGPGYQLHLSKICIGTGELTGQGWNFSSFVQYKPPPDRHNDFIFAMIAHQWGLFGALFLLMLYGLIILGGIEIAAGQPDPFGKLLAIGISALLAAQMFINIGMTMGMMPVTGMTLPFVSYGGSSLIANSLALGLLVNVARHKPRQIANRPFEFDD